MKSSFELYLNMGSKIADYFHSSTFLYEIKTRLLKNFIFIALHYLLDIQKL